MKRYLFIFLLFISTGLYGQIQEHYHDRGDAEPVTGGMSSDLSHPKQVFTPNAANLGVYGKVPVDYYTGTADVQIPLAELKGKDCTQPVYISYRTGGHKVSETPGPFGLGWTLHAGGCINRIVNGEKDELSEAEYNFLTRTEPQSDEYREFVGQLHLSEPGYMYHNNLIQSYSFYIDAFKRPRHYDLAPDEFQICAEGLSGSFYIGRGQKPVLISKAPASYQISYQIDSINTPVALYRSTDNSSVIEANYFTFISKIIITDSEGVKYTFGGDMTSIDFSYSPTNTPSISYHHDQSKPSMVHPGNMTLDAMEESYWQSYAPIGPRIIATANTWHLVSKEFPATGEKIVYTYEKKGFPIHVSDVNTRMVVLTDDATGYVNYNQERNRWINISFTDERAPSTFHMFPKTNLSYTILNPSYLTRIESQKTKDTIRLSYQDLDGLTSFPDDFDFGMIFGIRDSYSFIRNNNRYYTATGIGSPRGSASLQYSRDKTGILVGKLQDGIPYNDNPLSFLSGNQAQVVAPTSSNPPQDSLDMGHHYSPMTSVAFPEENRRYRIHLEKVILNMGTSAQREYTLKYKEERLPYYETKVTDHWGYYCGSNYGLALSTKYNTNVIMSDEFCTTTLQRDYDERRKANLYGLAESLVSITYPTGGETAFVYEQHEYHKVAELYPQRIQFDHGFAGGFRIKEILDSDGGKTVTRRFTYNDSGILNGKPKYSMLAHYTSESEDSVLENDSYVNLAEGQVIKSTLRFASEGSINQIPTSSGSHIAYSQVTEHLADGSTITYKYSDWAEYPDIQAETYHSFRAKDLMNPFTSSDIMRGLLKEITYTNVRGTIVKKEEMTYRDAGCNLSGSYGDLNTGLYSYAMRMIYPGDSPWYYGLNQVYKFFPPTENRYTAMPYYMRLSRTYIFGKTPYLIKKKVTTWDANGLSPMVVTTQYSYNSRNQLVSEITTGASVTEHRTLWSGEIGNGPYVGMTEAGMTGLPVEETVIENGKVISSSLHEYALTPYGHYHPIAEYRSQSLAGISSSLFQPYDGAHKDPSYGNTPEATYTYDAQHNVITTIRRDATVTNVIWGYNGTSPVMICTTRGPASIAYYTFENDQSLNSILPDFWNGFHSPKSHTGPYTLSLPSDPGVSIAVIDYMVKNSLGNWSYRRKEVKTSLGTYTINEGSFPIDNIRVYPKGAQVASYTWIPKIGVRSTVDNSGDVLWYDYDFTGRLKAVFDIDGNPVNGYYYKYKTSNGE